MNYFDVDKMQLCQFLYDSEHEDSQNHTPEHSDIIKCRESNVKLKFAVVVLARKAGKLRNYKKNVRQLATDVFTCILSSLIPSNHTITHTPNPFQNQNKKETFFFERFTTKRKLNLHGGGQLLLWARIFSSDSHGPEFWPIHIQNTIR